jgi:hypothetical protein
MIHGCVSHKGTPSIRNQYRNFLMDGSQLMAIPTFHQYPRAETTSSDPAEVQGKLANVNIIKQTI